MTEMRTRAPATWRGFLTTILSFSIAASRVTGI